MFVAKIYLTRCQSPHLQSLNKFSINGSFRPKRIIKWHSMYYYMKSCLYNPNCLWIVLNICLLLRGALLGSYCISFNSLKKWNMLPLVTTTIIVIFQTRHPNDLNVLLPLYSWFWIHLNIWLLDCIPLLSSICTNFSTLTR